MKILTQITNKVKIRYIGDDPAVPKDAQYQLTESEMDLLIYAATKEEAIQLFMQECKTRSFA